VKWAVAVTATDRNPSWLGTTLHSLGYAGWDDPILWAEPGLKIPSEWHRLRVIRNPRRLGPHFNFRAALTGLVAAQPDVDAYAVFQDDVRVTVGLRTWLENELWPSNRVGVVSLFTASINAATRAGWHRCDDLPRRATGAQAYVFPRLAARAFASAPPVSNSWAKTDYWVGKWCRDSSLEYWMHSPSLALHIGRDSSISDRGLDRFRQCSAFLERISASGWITLAVPFQQPIEAPDISRSVISPGPKPQLPAAPGASPRRRRWAGRSAGSAGS